MSEFERWCVEKYGWPSERLCHKDGADLEAAYTAGDRAGYERGMREAAGIAQGYIPDSVEYDGYDAFAETKEGIASAILSTIPTTETECCNNKGESHE